MSLKQIKTVIIGYGYWGTNLVRNLLINPNYKVLAIVDSSASAIKRAQKEIGIPTFSSVSELPRNLEFDLTLISTNPSMHLPIFKLMSNRSKNFLITKPVCASYLECQELEQIAYTNGNHIFVDFTYHFSPLYRYMWSSFMPARDVVSPLEITSYRTSLGIYQQDISVIADLMVHDIYIILKSLRWKMPSSIECIGHRFRSELKADSAFAKISWDNQTSAEIHVSWKSPKKIRHFSVVSPENALVIEELSSDSPVQLINLSSSTLNPVESKAFQVSRSRIASALVPEIHRSEPLKIEIQELAETIMENSVTHHDSFPKIDRASAAWLLIDQLEKGVS